MSIVVEWLLVPVAGLLGAGITLGLIAVGQRLSARAEERRLAAQPEFPAPSETSQGRRPIEVWIDANADEAELKRLYGEDVLIHRSDR